MTVLLEYISINDMYDVLTNFNGSAQSGGALATPAPPSELHYHSCTTLMYVYRITCTFSHKEIVRTVGRFIFKDKNFQGICGNLQNLKNICL